MWLKTMLSTIALAYVALFFRIPAQPAVTADEIAAKTAIDMLLKAITPPVGL